VQQASSDDSECDDKLPALATTPRSPGFLAASPARGVKCSNDDEVFLFDNNIPSIASRMLVPSSPDDQTEIRRRKKLLKMISDPKSCKRALMRSVSLHDTDRNGSYSASAPPRESARNGGGLSTSWADGSLEHALRAGDRLDRNRDSRVAGEAQEEDYENWGSEEDLVPSSNHAVIGVFPNRRCNGKASSVEDGISSSFEKCSLVCQSEADHSSLNGSTEAPNEEILKKTMLSDWRNKAA